MVNQDQTAKTSVGLSPAVGRVGVVSASQAGLDEVAAWLRREHVALSHAIYDAGPGTPPVAEAAPLLRGLRLCQDDAETEIILLLAPKPSPEATRLVLDQVRRSEKPTVVCFLGTDPRLLWRAGAIPAARLDEAALRAIAWVRGWDQALITSQLEELDEQMEAQAQKLRPRLDPARRRFWGLFTDEIFYQEAQAVWEQLRAPRSPQVLGCYPPAERRERLRAALADPETALILLDIVLDRAGAAEPAAALAPNPKGPVVVAHISGGEPGRRAAQEARLRRAGVVVAPSSAAAAHLAGRLAVQLLS